MQNTYWTLFVIALFTIVASIAFIVLVSILLSKGKLGKKYFVGTSIALSFAIFLGIYILVPCVKDFEYAVSGTYIEDKMTAIEFTYANDNLDGNGITQYAKPKFLVERTGQYIVLFATDIELGKQYIVRYYPNTKICEVTELGNQQ